MSGRTANTMASNSMKSVTAGRKHKGKANAEKSDPEQNSRCNKSRGALKLWAQQMHVMAFGIWPHSFLD